MERSCFTCQLGKVCFAKLQLDEIIYNNNLSVNIDSDSAPGKTNDVYEALGNCCLHYISNE
jgi:hypothetical protein